MLCARLLLVICKLCQTCWERLLNTKSSKGSELKPAGPICGLRELGINHSVPAFYCCAFCEARESTFSHFFLLNHLRSFFFYHMQGPKGEKGDPGRQVRLCGFHSL